MESFKSKKIGIFSDIHIGLGQDSSLWHEVTLEFGKWAAKKFENLGITEIVIPGDIFHNRSDISVKTLDVAKQLFDIFEEFQLVISTGNHDCYRKMDSEIHSLSLLKEWKNIEVVDYKPKIFKTSVGKTISLIPWATKTDDMPLVDIMFAHIDIKSFYMNGYKMCDHGFESADLFKKAKYVISGHYHKKDFREYNDGKILYIGSPFQHNYGDVGDERGIYVFNLEDESFEFIENTVSPKHKKIKISDLVTKKITAEDLKKEIPNNMVCLVIDKNLTPDIQSILVSKIQNLNPKFLKIEHQEPDIDVSIDGNHEFEITDISKTLEDYVEAMNTSNKEELKEYLLSIYAKTR